MGGFSFALQPSWISVDFDNWRDWEHEEDEGKEEYERYMDVSKCSVSSCRIVLKSCVLFLILTFHLCV